MKKEPLWRSVKKYRAVLLAVIFLLGMMIWDGMEQAHLDERFASGIELDTTIAQIEYAPPGWLKRGRWYARYRTYEGREVRARFWPRHEYPRNPRHHEKINVVYLKEDVEQCRWLPN